jgi:hypothetical protein
MPLQWQKSKRSGNNGGNCVEVAVAEKGNQSA